MIDLPAGDTDFFDIFTGVLQEDTVAPDMPRLWTTNVNRSKGKWFHIKK